MYRSSQPLRLPFREQQDQSQRVLEGQATRLPRHYLVIEELPLLDRPDESPVRRSLRPPSRHLTISASSVRYA